jgi:hypothetical protein
MARPPRRRRRRLSARRSKDSDETPFKDAKPVRKAKVKKIAKKGLRITDPENANLDVCSPRGAAVSTKHRPA